MWSGYDHTNDREEKRDTPYMAPGWALLNDLLVYTLVFIFLIICIEGTELIIKIMRNGEEFVFFNDSPFRFPAKWLFDAADGALILALSYQSVMLLLRSNKSRKRVTPRREGITFEPN
jgi:hypothetical protein